MLLGPMRCGVISVVVAFALLDCGVGLDEEHREAAPYSIVTPLAVGALPDYFLGFDRYFSQHIQVIEPACQDCLGVHVVASRTVASAKVERVANVLAQYLDNDEDGLADNPLVAEEMDRSGALMVMFAHEEEMTNFSCGGYVCQDDFDNETGLPLPAGVNSHAGGKATLGQVVMDSAVGRFADQHLRCAYNRSVICDAALEEAFHLVTDVGYGPVYPEQLGTHAGSALSLAMMGTIGDCGYNTPATLVGEYARYRFPNCTGSYHYGDWTCEFSCLVTEFLHHLLASYNGEYTWGRADLPIPNPSFCASKDARASEWENCVEGPGRLEASRQLLAAAVPAGLALLLDPRFRMPLVMPSGKYSPSAFRFHKAVRHPLVHRGRTLRIENVKFVLDKVRP